MQTKFYLAKLFIVSGPLCALLKSFNRYIT